MISIVIYLIYVSDVCNIANIGGAHYVRDGLLFW